jgi:two-component system sensor histidine kinase UhpB
MSLLGGDSFANSLAGREFGIAASRSKGKALISPDTVVAGPPERQVRAWILLLGIMAAWQALLWPVIHVAERAARPVDIDRRSEVSYQFIDAKGGVEGGRTYVAQLRHAPVGYTISETSEAPRARFLVRFDVADTSRPLSLFLAVRNSIDEIRLNGEIIQSLSALPKLKGLVTSEPGYVSLPPERLVTGVNELALDTPNFGSQWLSEFAIGPSEALAENFRWKTLLQTDIALAGMAILVFAILLCLVVRWPVEDRPRIMALVALLATCAFSTYLLTFSPPVPLSLEVTVFLYVLSNLFIAMAVLTHVLLDQRRPISWLKYAWTGWAGALAISVAAIAGAVWIGPSNTWFREMISASFWVVIIVGGVAIVLLAYGLVRDNGARWFERTILAFCISAFVIDRLGTIFPLKSPFDPGLQLTLGWSPIVGGLLGLSMVVALAREATEARRTVLSANDILRARLNEREAELRESHAREQEIQKRTVLLEERQRIVRDMHDGIGGQLLGLAVQVKAKQLDPTGVEEALQASISDMRLIVDSLDSAEEGVADALRGFEHRVRAQASAIQAEFHSRIELGEEDAVLGPRGTLQVLRILQESVANAIRHARPSRIELRAGLNADGQVAISLSDNGPGIQPGASEGRGLASMKARAASLGARLDVVSNGSGTTVRLVLPAAVAECVA